MTIEQLEQLEKVEKVPIYIAKIKKQNISEDLKLKDFISYIDGFYYATGYIYDTSRFTLSDWTITDDAGRSIDIIKSTVRIKFYKNL